MHTAIIGGINYGKSRQINIRGCAFLSKFKELSSLSFRKEKIAPCNTEHLVALPHNIMYSCRGGLVKCWAISYRYFSNTLLYFSRCLANVKSKSTQLSSSFLFTLTDDSTKNLLLTSQIKDAYLLININ